MRKIIKVWLYLDVWIHPDSTKHKQEGQDDNLLQQIERDLNGFPGKVDSLKMETG